MISYIILYHTVLYHIILYYIPPPWVTPREPGAPGLVGGTVASPGLVPSMGSLPEFPWRVGSPDPWGGFGRCGFPMGSPRGLMGKPRLCLLILSSMGLPCPAGFGLWSGLLGCWVIGFGPVSLRGCGVPAPPAGRLPEADCPPWSTVWPWLIPDPACGPAHAGGPLTGRAGLEAWRALRWLCPFAVQGWDRPWLGRGARVFA